jgi:radical SAM protein with 4Fe4S-binding SPASM domain
MTVTVEDLETELKLKFNVKVLCDLAKVSNSPGTLMKLLDSVYQTQYQDNERLIFYTSHLPSDRFLQHLYNTFNSIDISNWFVLICGPAKLEEVLIRGCEKFSTDPVPFQFYAVDLAPTELIENKFELPSTMCAIPWHNIELQPDGNITPCCMSTLTLGNIKNVSLSQAFHGDAVNKLRADLLSGEKPSECNNCWKLEEKNLTSIRMHNVKRLQKDLLTQYLHDPQITNFDIKFNNTCNFKCRICGPSSSSLFAQEQHRFLGKPLITQENWAESKDFIDQMASHLPKIRNIDMFGGEPFLIKKFKEVLKSAVEQDYAKDIRLHYNSNGSIWPEHLLPYWPSFKLVDIHFSIDAIGEQFELQRGGSWQDVENNILKLKNLGLPNLSISIMPTISVMNIYYIDRVYNWAVQHGFPIFVSHVRGPGLELSNLTAQAKAMIIEKYKDHPWKEMQQVLDIIKQLPDSNGAEFQKKIQWFDQVRQENFATNHSEIAKAMGI